MTGVDHQTNVTLQDELVFEYNETVIQKEKNFIVPSNSTVVIKLAGYNVIITPPNGTDIIDYSNESIDIVYENFAFDTIRINESIMFFAPMNFISTIRGLNNYTVQVYYDRSFLNESIKEVFTHYTIDWGDGQTTSGDGILPERIEHKYIADNHQYNMSVTLRDADGVIYTYSLNQVFLLSREQYATLWASENKETIAVGTSGTLTGMALLGFALTETGKYKLLALLALMFPMFTQERKDDVLDHFVRGEIYGFIKANPGSHYNQMMRELDIKNGTLSYHLYILEKTGIVKSRKEGIRYRVFYPTDMKFPEEERYRLTEMQIKIMQLISSHPGLNQKKVAKLLNETHQTISYNMKVLQQAGLINVQRDGRKRKYYRTSTQIDALS
jgi:DNA-binding transcriptional ArsR family regulator